MSNANSLEQIDRQIDAWFSVFLDAYYECFLLLHNYVFVPLASLDAKQQWTYVVAISITLTMAGFRLSKILPTERCWELFLIRAVLARGILITIPLSILVWYSSLYIFASKALPDDFAMQINQYLAGHAEQFFNGIVIGIITGLTSILMVGKKLEPAISRWLAGRTRSAAMDNPVKDVTRVFSHLPKAKRFNPEKYFPKARKKSSYFFGMQSGNIPTFVSRKQFNESNVLIVGPTRTGKGIKAGVVLSQCLAFDNADIVIAIDPKCDDWGPLVLKRACEVNGLPFYYVNLNRGHGAQFNPLQSVSKEELIPLLVASYDLAAKGTPDDYYRQQETAAIENIVEQCSDNPTLGELYRLFNQSFDDKELDNLRSLQSKLKQDAGLTAMQTTHGPNFDDLLETGGVFWVY